MPVPGPLFASCRNYDDCKREGVFYLFASVLPEAKSGYQPKGFKGVDWHFWQLYERREREDYL
jgi:hypothetical protein